MFFESGWLFFIIFCVFVSSCFVIFIVVCAVAPHAQCTSIPRFIILWVYRVSRNKVGQVNDVSPKRQQGQKTNLNNCLFFDAQASLKCSV